MYLKRLFLLATFICFIFAFSINAYALPEEVVGVNGEVKVTTTSDTKTTTTSDTKTTTTSDTKTTTTGDTKTTTTGDTKTTTTGDTKTTTTGETKTTTTGDTKAETKADTKAETKADKKVEVVEEVEEDKGFFETFKINQEELKANVASGNRGLYFVSEDGESSLQSDDSDINDYKVFSLNKGFSKRSVVTFAKSNIFSGKGDEATKVGIIVFRVNDQEIMTSSESIEKIGASGVYNSSVSLEKGDNNVIFAVRKEGVIVYRLFKVTVKEEETKGKLENIEINFMPQKTTTDQKPSSIPSIPSLPGMTVK